MRIDRMQKRSAFVALALATLAGCLSFDALTGGQNADDDASIDASTTTPESSTGSDSSISDSSTQLTDAFSCAAFPDASLCDDFNRDAAIPFSDLRWNKTDCLPGDKIDVNGTLNVTMPPTTTDHCMLLSNPIPNTGHFTLDFDLEFQSLDAAAPGDVIIAQVNFALKGTATNEAGIHDVTFQFLVGASGNAQFQLLDHYPYPDGGNLYASTTLASATPFVEPGTRCHVSLVGDDTALNPSGTATSSCDGANLITMVTGSVNPNARGLSGGGTLLVGYSNNNQSKAPAWTVSYDNVVYAAQ